MYIYLYISVVLFIGWLLLNKQSDAYMRQLGYDEKYPKFDRLQIIFSINLLVAVVCNL